MSLRKAFALLVCMAVSLCAAGFAHGGLIRAVKDKHKANADGLHAKIQAAIKDHKAYSGHHHGK